MSSRAIQDPLGLSLSKAFSFSEKEGKRFEKLPRTEFYSGPASGMEEQAALPVTP
jgi:hypothetical protein